MANHVTTRIWIAEGNEAAHQAMQRINQSHLDLKETWEHQVPAFAMWEDTLALYDAEKWSELMDEIGTKWCYVFDWDDEDSISFESAWGTPSDLLERIAKEITEADPDAILAYHSEDECPNWVSSGVFADGELYDEEYIDSDEFRGMGIVLWWDEDEEGKEEPDDFEPNWDELYEVMDSNVDAMIEAVKWNRDEEDTLDD
jgi:hypothetical protein